MADVPAPAQQYSLYTIADCTTASLLIQLSCLAQFPDLLVLLISLQMVGIIMRPSGVQMRKKTGKR